MCLHMPELTRQYVKNSLTGVLASNGYIAKDYRGDLDTETLENVDSLGAYEVALDLSDKLDIDLSDEDITTMFGDYDLAAAVRGEENRNIVSASKVIDYVSSLVEQRSL